MAKPNLDAANEQPVLPRKKATPGLRVERIDESKITNIERNTVGFGVKVNGVPGAGAWRSGWGRVTKVKPEPDELLTDLRTVAGSLEGNRRRIEFEPYEAMSIVVRLGACDDDQHAREWVFQRSELSKHRSAGVLADFLMKLILNRHPSSEG